MKTGPVLVWELLDDLLSYYEQDAGKKPGGVFKGASMKVQDLVEAVLIALVLEIIALYLYASYARFE